ncbi:hypothetical protein EsH8_II_001579 [Colletotrichum jinshuiense]
MKTQFLIFTLLYQAAFFVAMPLKWPGIERCDNLDDIEMAIAPVFNSLQMVDAAVLVLDGSASTAKKLLTASQQTQITIEQATPSVRAAGDLTAAKSLKLRRTTDMIIGQTTITVNDLVSRKPILDKLGVSSLVLESLQRQKTSSMALSRALAEKVPKAGQRIAGEGMDNLQSVMNQAIAAYSIPATVPPTSAAPVAVLPPQILPASRHKDKKKKGQAHRHDVEMRVEREFQSEGCV